MTTTVRRPFLKIQRAQDTPIMYNRVSSSDANAKGEGGVPNAGIGKTIVSALCTDIANCHRGNCILRLLHPNFLEHFSCSTADACLKGSFGA